MSFFSSKSLSFFTPSQWEFQDIWNGARFGRDGVYKSGLVAKIRIIFLTNDFLPALRGYKRVEMEDTYLKAQDERLLILRGLPDHGEANQNANLWSRRTESEKLQTNIFRVLIWRVIDQVQLNWPTELAIASALSMALSTYLQTGNVRWITKFCLCWAFSEIFKKPGNCIILISNFDFDNYGLV